MLSYLRRTWSQIAGTEASQLVEFAVALPLLVVFVVGIFDFGQAFNLKQKLSNAAREGARLGSSLPTGDLGTTGVTPTSVDAAKSAVTAYIIAANINDCGLAAQAAASAGSLTWTYTASGSGCPAALTLTIERGYKFQTTVNSTQVDVLCTRVTISYPYQWHFSRVIELLAPGSNYAGVTHISTDAIAPNTY
ncbi:MAG TPA: TadE/TadG family type IV pilus assembly protein [Terriglobales bacterium]|nr:TadE/TadG family type IV pilus assembly protein [Terriglobales bacterium]